MIGFYHIEKSLRQTQTYASKGALEGIPTTQNSTPPVSLLET
jgi:hypothetical protein